jgi:ATP-binding cassette, subfamily B, bacterial PglK
LYTTIRQALQLLGHKQRTRWAVLVLIALVASGFEMVGAVLVFVLVALVSDPSGSIDLPLLGDVRSVLSSLDQDALLVTVAAAMAVFFVLRGAVQIVSLYIQRRVAENAGAQLSTHLVRGYLRAPYSTHLRRTSSELIRNSNLAVQQVVSQVYMPMIRVTAEIFLTVGLLAVLLSVAPAAAGLAVVVVGGAAGLILLVVQPRLKRLGRVAHGVHRESLSILQQALYGVRDIKLLGREEFFTLKYARTRRKLARANYRRGLWSRLPATVIELALLGFILMFFSLSVIWGSSAQEILPVLGLFAYAGLRLQPSLQQIVSGLNDLRFSAAPIDDLAADLRAFSPSIEPSNGTPPPTFAGSIEFRDVSFQYEATDRNAVSGLTFRIEPGEVVGICGPTGGGKTTLIDLLTGLLHPSTGRVTVNDLDLVEHWRAWHRHLGVVPQMAFLLDDTVRRNIALGVPDADVDEEALREAIVLAQLKDFIESLPQGMETQIGERGVRVSGGQRQRLTIARALYRQPTVLIFDEGTSALDNATESELLRAVSRLRGDRTIILVAHRLSTVRDADRIIFVDDARIAGIDTFAELVRTNEQFRVLAGER